MSVQQITEFESQVRRLCEDWRTKLTHCELVGILDTVKMDYHIKTIQDFEGPMIIPESVLSDKPIPLDGSPLPAEVENG